MTKTVVRKTKLRGAIEVSLQIIGSIALFCSVVALLIGKINHDYEQAYGPKIRTAERYADALRICEKFGADCELYACYRTEKGNFICQDPQ